MQKAAYKDKPKNMETFFKFNRYFAIALIGEKMFPKDLAEKARQDLQLEIASDFSTFEALVFFMMVAFPKYSTSRMTVFLADIRRYKVLYNREHVEKYICLAYDKISKTRWKGENIFQNWEWTHIESKNPRIKSSSMEKLRYTVNPDFQRFAKARFNDTFKKSDLDFSDLQKKMFIKITMSLKNFAWYVILAGKCGAESFNWKKFLLEEPFNAGFRVGDSKKKSQDKVGIRKIVRLIIGKYVNKKYIQCKYRVLDPSGEIKVTSTFKANPITFQDSSLCKKEKRMEQSLVNNYEELNPYSKFETERHKADTRSRYREEILSSASRLMSVMGTVIEYEGVEHDGASQIEVQSRMFTGISKINNAFRKIRKDEWRNCKINGYEVCVVEILNLPTLYYQSCLKKERKGEIPYNLFFDNLPKNLQKLALDIGVTSLMKYDKGIFSNSQSRARMRQSFRSSYHSYLRQWLDREQCNKYLHFIKEGYFQTTIRKEGDLSWEAFQMKRALIYSKAFTSIVPCFLPHYSRHTLDNVALTSFDALIVPRGMEANAVRKLLDAYGSLMGDLRKVVVKVTYKDKVCHYRAGNKNTVKMTDVFGRLSRKWKSVPLSEQSQEQENSKEKEQEA